MANVTIYRKNNSVVLESTDLTTNYMFSGGDIWVSTKNSLIQFFFEDSVLFDGYEFTYTEVLNEVGSPQASLADTLIYLSIELNFYS